MKSSKSPGTGLSLSLLRATLRSRWTRACAVLSLLLLAPGIASSSTVAVESFALTARLNGLLLSAQGDALGPESDWNRQKSILAGSGLIVLTPDDSSGGALRQTELLTLTKLVLQDTVLNSSGQIASWFNAGTLAAVELELFGSKDPAPAPVDSAHLGTIGELTGLDSSGQAATLGRFFCYDAARYQARVTALATVSGGPVSGSRRLFTGPVVQASGDGSFAVFLNTNGSSLVGDIVSNGGIRLDGDDNTVPERLRARSSVVVTGSGSVIGSQASTGLVTALPAPRQPAVAYEDLAKAAGTFFDSSIAIVTDGAGGFETAQGLAVSGIVYATGDIQASFSGATGSLTLIAEGSIEYLGNNNSVSAAVDDLAAWAIKDPVGLVDKDVVISGSGNALEGRVFAPGGTVRLPGDGCSIVGSLYGWRVVVSGDGQTITDGTTL